MTTTTFKGKISLDIRDSKPDWTPFLARKAPRDAPNVLVVLYDDTGLAGHPSAILVPTILSEAAETGANGRAMIAAYVAGYELWAEMMRRDPDQHHRKGWHPTAMFGTIAAAGAVSSLRGHDAAMATSPCCATR